MSTDHPQSQRTFDQLVELICRMKEHAMERRDYELLGMADRVDALLLRLVNELNMKASHLLSQRTFARLVELVRCIKRHASEGEDQELLATADQVDALVRRLATEVNMEASSAHPS